MGTRIKKDDLVVVIAGKDKGQKGRVLRVLSEVDRVLVEGVNKIKRHTKPTPKAPQGGIIEREAPIHASNVMLWDEKASAPSRVKAGQDKDGKKVRILVKSGTALA
jgi:large subunit ribosomal protein L24